MENLYQRKSFNKFIFLVLFLDALGLVMTFIYASTAIADEFEHIRVGWFVSQGDVPYRDFFEHHHPLIWYLFAPLIVVMPQQVLPVLYTMRGISALFSIGSLIILFQMVKHYFGGIKVACFFLALYFLYYPSWYSFSSFKPDTFMRFFYLLGLYLFFIFYEKKQMRFLIGSGISFTISFFFLQTILTSIFPLIFPLGWMLYKKEIRLRQVIAASLIPLLMCLSALYVFYLQGALTQYIQLNWIYNSRLFASVKVESNISYEFGIYILISAIGCFWLWKRKKMDIYLSIITLLAAGEALRLIIISSSYPHYFVMLFIYCAVINSVGIKYIKESILVNTTKAGLLFGILMNFATLYVHNNQSIIYTYKQITEEQAKILNCFTISNIWEKRTHYYWYIPNMEALDTVLFNRYPDFDVNDYVENNKIKYISAYKKICVSPDMFRYENLPPHAASVIQHYIIKPEVMDKYEKVSADLYKRKD